MNKMNKMLVIVSICIVIVTAIGFMVKYLSVDRPREVVEKFIEQRDSLATEDRRAMAKKFSDRVPEFLLYARVAQATYEKDSSSELERLLDGYSFSSADSLEADCLKIQAGVNLSKRRLLVVFRGSVPECSFNIKANLEHGILGETELYSKSRDFVETVKTEYAGYALTLVGHSLGGGMAINNGIAHGDSDVYTFNTAFPNSMGLESVQLKKWTVGNVKNGGVKRTKVTNIIMEGDEISGLSLFKFHGLVGETFMLFHEDVPARNSFDHLIEEVVYKLEVIDSQEEQEKNAIGFNAFVGRKMEL